jgi:hypothetical protein
VTAAALLGGLALVATLPPAPASAVCQLTVDGHCYNACSVAGIAYVAAANAARKAGATLAPWECAA